MNANNVYFNMPAMMQDGRQTNYNPNATFNELNMNSANIVSNNEYRKYLQNNADLIIKQNQEFSNNKVSNHSHKNEQTPNTNEMGPYMYASVNDQTKPFGYVDSDLKNIYLSRNELQSKLYTPVVNIHPHIQEKYLK